MSDFTCNILVLGATGTGKSSLINYLCGEKIAKTGAGRPVTEEDIFEYNALLNGQPVRIYDSWGIEAGKVEQWKKMLDSILKDHGVDKPVNEWFHSVMYCIQQGGARSLETDFKIIRQFLKEGYNVLVILTKADQITKEEELKSMKNAIREGVGENCNIIPCYTGAETRKGLSEPFGRDEITSRMIISWRETVINRLPRHIINRMENEIDEWREKIAVKIENNEYKLNGSIKAYKNAWAKIQGECYAFSEQQEKAFRSYLSEESERFNSSSTALCTAFNTKQKTAADASDSSLITKIMEILNLQKAINLGKKGLRLISNFFNREIGKQKKQIIEKIDAEVRTWKGRFERKESTIKNYIEKFI